MEKKDIDAIIENKRHVKDKQNSIRILNDYQSYLDETGEYKEILTYIKKELFSNIIYECYFGRNIYSVEDLTDFFNYHKQNIEKKLNKIFLSSRDRFVLNLYLNYKGKMWDMFDIVLEVIKQYNGVPWEIVNCWLKEALDDIKGARRDLRAGAYKKSLNRLQRAVEVLLKAYALYIGLKTEEELKKDVRHAPLEIYIEILKKSWVTRAKNIFNIKKDVTSSIEYLEKQKKIGKNTEDIKKKLIEWDKSIPFFLKNYEKIDKKINKVFSKVGVRYLLKFCKAYMNTKAYHKAWFGFSALLLPLSVSTQYYSSRFTYPDFSRKLDVEYQEMYLIKNLNRICYLLEENIKLLKNSFNDENRFSYTLMSETLEYELKDINHIFDDEEKIKTILSSINNIKANNYIQILIKKIKTNEIVKKVSISSLN